MVEMLIDTAMADTRYQVAVHRIVDADPATTYEAITRANLFEPAVRWLFEAREIPNMIATRRSEGKWPERAPKEITFADIANDSAWMILAERAGEEFVAGAVGRFWESGYGWRDDVEPEDFAAFSEPGYAKTVIGLSVRPYGSTRSLLSYDSRTEATDEEARQKFGRYWIAIRPFARLVMSRALLAIARHAERQGEDNRTLAAQRA